MAVAKLSNHIAENLKKLLVSHFIVNHGGITRVDFIPIHTETLFLIVEEAVTLVHQLPQCLEIAVAGVGGGYFLLDTRDQHKQRDYVENLFQEIEIFCEYKS